MPEKIYLIGEHHYDLFRRFRYGNAIDKFNPNVVSLELSKGLQKGDFEIFENLLKSFYKRNNVELAKDFFLGPDYITSCVISDRPNIVVSYSDVLQEEVSINIENKLENRIDNLTEEEVDKYYKSFISQIKPLLYTYKALNEKFPSSQKSITLFERGFIDQKFLNLLMDGSKDQVYTAQIILDFIYSLNCSKFELGDIACEISEAKKRDDMMIDKLLSLDGLVLHFGGLEHFYGNYDNMYTKLKKKRVPVKRFKLVDFDHPKDLKERALLSLARMGTSLYINLYLMKFLREAKSLDK